jgi:hypothetical protein
MNFSIFKKFTLEKNLIYVLIAAVIIVAGFISYLFLAQFQKGIEIISPNGGEEWGIGQTYKVVWEAKSIENVGIVLFKGKEPKWIAKNIPAKLGEYEWKIYPGQDYRDDYWVAVFEYPLKENSRIDYSEGPFAITYPELLSCDSLSVENEWPYLPSDLPNLRRVFITKNEYSGNLGGFEGADEICQKEAEERGFGGVVWHAFIGGDKKNESALSRIEKTPRGTKGIFIQAQPSADLMSRQATCHRVLGRNLNEFLNKFSNLVIINNEKLEQNFLQDLSNLWIGKINENSQENCIQIYSVISRLYMNLAEKYSFTTSCQDWTKEDVFVQNYLKQEGIDSSSFPTCYTPEGKFTNAVALGGLSSGLEIKQGVNFFTPQQGTYCNVEKKLLCIEE